MAANGKLDPAKVEAIKKALASGSVSVADLAAKYGVSQSTIYYHCKGGAAKASGVQKYRSKGPLTRAAEKAAPVVSKRKAAAKKPVAVVRKKAA